MVFVVDELIFHCYAEDRNYGGWDSPPARARARARAGEGLMVSRALSAGYCGL
jgi:hypothetical protein